MASNGHTLQLHDILRQSGKRITTGQWREIHPNFWKKNNQKPKTKTSRPESRPRFVGENIRDLTELVTQVP